AAPVDRQDRGAHRHLGRHKLTSMPLESVLVIPRLLHRAEIMTVPAATYPAEAPARQMVRRSSLIMPVNVPAFVERAHLRGADAIVLDLEDSIPPAEKARARALVQAAIPLVARGGADVLVRINRPWELGAEDLEAAVWPGLSGIAFP